MGVGVFKVNFSTPVINKLSIIIFYQMRVRSGKEEGISSYKLLDPPFLGDWSYFLCAELPTSSPQLPLIGGNGANF